ncbi:MAG: hypothetical protein CGU28_10280 [Candidatus Dactylopiibacterium carminicum]|uniref:Integrase catalytic domain-containing protein n=1 Tax=Candidatus Dactylopiibacterium carminicum TaxID=857335 RepID=A0A272EQV7_9RHOO|nr:hypothetical protein [Candidatus Dactylopiibacterium carminicum]KAF7600709.1 hypothetical protein BGI27_00980 [Candidatus Dactylopiibacterium carminicum]PAS92468.1 MAG: hypothetical protein CGU29_11365 [Candidatus Dactylopiibacterium carminicum]PAS96038.1 MAG: hypothetical protein CGU28_10280 [Candidatus Dactylopiibacterium carminicum]PAT00715.1 MAG: hypothetical protein BSR46_00990 [Candidatus Dactylopiibacterium carminicum]
MSPAMIESLIAIRAAAEAAGHGGKSAVYAEACSRLGISLPTLHRYLGQIAVKAPRKQRADAGDVSLPLAEAQLISALLMDSLRKTNKRLKSIGEAVDLLRANGEIRAERLDDATGELIKLSYSAIARALRTYGLHPDQLLRPEPAKELASLHPNHAWQIDASLCVLYYLNARTEKESGLQVMEHSKFYKNKPANLKRIKADRVWSYESTDHWSGAIKLNYVMGAESALNLAESFIRFTQQWDDQPFYGVPYILMMDMGSAMTSGAFKNLARRLDVELIAHAPGNGSNTGGLTAGTTYRLKIRAEGTSHKVYLDGALKVTATSSDLIGAGLFGVRAYATSTVTGVVDNVSITSLDTTSNLPSYKITLSSQRGDLKSRQAHSVVVGRA